MADAVLSGYKATLQDGLTTEMNSLANEGFTALGAEQNNSSTKYMMCDIEVYIDPSTAAGTTGDEAVEIYLIPSADDANYPTWTSGTSDAQENNQYYVGSVTIKQGATTDKAVLRNVALPNGKFKWACRNRCNDSLAASGNYVKWRPHQYSSA